jgi:hypothetical protein
VASIIVSTSGWELMMLINSGAVLVLGLISSSIYLPLPFVEPEATYEEIDFNDERKSLIGERVNI